MMNPPSVLTSNRVGLVDHQDAGGVPSQVPRCLAGHDLEIAALEQPMRERVAIDAVATDCRSLLDRAQAYLIPASRDNIGLRKRAPFLEAEPMLS